MRLKGKVVMITGAGSGFGKAAAARFREEGAILALSDVEMPTGDADFAAPLDVTDSAAHSSFVGEVLARFGRLDIAINNAGIGQTLAPLQKTTETTYDRIMEINAKGVFLGLQQQLPPMIEAGQGAVLNIASAAGLVGAGHMAAYAASKHAVVGMTRAAADEVARHGVRVNALCPSFAETPLFHAIADDMADQSDTTRSAASARISGRVPMRRVATVDEIVQAMLWAVDPANSFMTGQAIAIDGGLTAV